MTATGWSYQTLYDTSFCDINDLLNYWIEEPPTHVILALRYLGPRKRSKQASEEDTRNQLAEVGMMMGRQAQALPAHLKEMIRGAEQLKQQHKGL